MVPRRRAPSRQSTPRQHPSAARRCGWGRPTRVKNPILSASKTKTLHGAQAVRAELAEGGALAPFRSVALRLGPTDEAAVAPALEALRSEFDRGVSVGSYPARPAAPTPAQRPIALYRHHVDRLLAGAVLPITSRLSSLAAWCVGFRV